MKTQAQIWKEYQDAVKDINRRHRQALDIAAGRYSKQSIALLKAKGPDNVGKPKRSKPDGPRSRP